MAKRTRSGSPIIWTAAAVTSALAIVLVVLSVDDIQHTAPLDDDQEPRSEAQSSAGILTPPPSATIVIYPTPAPTAVPGYVYIIQAGDTLWDIARRFEMTVEMIAAANPDLVSSELLYVGDEIIIPGAEVDREAIPDPEWPISGRVAADSEGLRLRTKPNLTGEILRELPALTPLTIVGKTSDDEWVAVRTPSLDGGWVKSDWVDIFLDLTTVPITWYSPLVSETEDPDAGGATPIPSASPDSYAFVSGVTENLLSVYARGQLQGNRANVFSKVGDSITVTAYFMSPFGTHDYALYEHDYLQPVIDYYNGSWARTHNSFANVSLAAGVGWTSWRMIGAGEGDPDFCYANETPLECEYRWLRPSVAIIMLGTNDVPGTAPNSYEYPLREIVKTSLDMGIIPVLTTIPPMDRVGVASRVLAYNQTVAEVASEFGVPMIDYYAAMQGLPNNGLSSDGVHPSTTPGRDSGHLSQENLRFGYPVRNLLTLQALDLILRVVVDAN